ncbi:MAG: TlpA family protein disulfide reductase [Endomicrobium sp.]|jgi:peroxiredoxin|nr:TlpA family protein disulfide reductase [Endomicrobium sp.]
MRIKYFFAGLILFVFAGVLFAKAAPDFKLLNTKGDTVKLSDFKGKIVFIDFWATWCSPCEESIPAVKNLHKRYASNSDIAILGLNLGEKTDTVVRFMKDKGINYEVLLCDDKTARNYGIDAIPAFFIIDKNGNIIKKYIGYANGSEADWTLKIKNELTK